MSSIRNLFGWGRNPNIIHLAGAAIRTRNHNSEDRNYDLNAHTHMVIRIIWLPGAGFATVSRSRALQATLLEV